MTLNTYLTFNGNCRDAFDFYREVFGGDFMLRSTFAEGPAGMGIPETEMNRIMHVSLPIGSSVLMGSDTCSAFGPPATAGNNFSISFSGESEAHCDELFAKLSESGTVLMPMQQMFWGAYFGQCKDKFGINWMISFSDAQSVNDGSEAD